MNISMSNLVRKFAELLIFGSKKKKKSVNVFCVIAILFCSVVKNLAAIRNEKNINCIFVFSRDLISQTQNEAGWRDLCSHYKTANVP